MVLERAGAPHHAQLRADRSGPGRSRPTPGHGVGLLLPLRPRANRPEAVSRPHRSPLPERYALGGACRGPGRVRGQPSRVVRRPGCVAPWPAAARRARRKWPVTSSEGSPPAGESPTVLRVASVRAGHLFLVLGFLSSQGCGSDSPPAATTATTEATTTTSTTSPCDATTQEAIETFGTVFDRLDADPQAVTSTGDDLKTIFRSLGVDVGRNCGQARAGESLSAVITYIAGEATRRQPITAEVIEGALSELCTSSKDPGLNVTLTRQAQAACAIG